MKSLKAIIKRIRRGSTAISAKQYRELTKVIHEFDRRREYSEDICSACINWDLATKQRSLSDTKFCKDCLMLMLQTTRDLA